MSYGEPKDEPGKCNARLFIGDNFGDNHATMRCSREPGHEGKHRERYTARGAGEVSVEWDRDEREQDDEPRTVEDLLKPIVLDEDDATFSPETEGP
jgi:hypothetical protein